MVPWPINPNTGKVSNRFHVRPTILDGERKYQVVDSRELTGQGKYRVVNKAQALSSAMAMARSHNAAQTNWGEGNNP